MKGGRGTVNLLVKCKMCSRENTLGILFLYVLCFYFQKKKNIIYAVLFYYFFCRYFD